VWSLAAKLIAEAGYYISIPSGLTRMKSYLRHPRDVRLDRILTETDAPYMGPHKDQRNEPSTVPQAVEAIAVPHTSALARASTAELAPFFAAATHTPVVGCAWSRTRLREGPDPPKLSRRVRGAQLWRALAIENH
jgi:hypothetical protein